MPLFTCRPKQKLPYPSPGPIGQTVPLSFAIILFSITNILVSIVTLFISRNVLLEKYAASPYDVFIENVLDTDIGQLLVGIGSTIIMLAMLVFAIAIFEFIRFRKSQYDKELLGIRQIVWMP